LIESLKQQVKAKEIHMYVDPNDLDALLAISTGQIIAYFKLKKTHQGTFEVVELMNDVRI
jgi:hypothetical protein